MRKRLCGMLVVIVLLTVVTSSLDLPILDSDVQDLARGSSKTTSTNPEEELLFMEETVRIFDNDSCRLTILMNASSRKLSDLYSRGLGFNHTGDHTWLENYTIPENISVTAFDGPQNLEFNETNVEVLSYGTGLGVTGDVPVNSSFCNGTRQQQLHSLGINITKFRNVTMYRVNEAVFLVYVDAYAEFLKIDKSDKNRTVSIGPSNLIASCDRANFILTQIGFVQEMLGSFEGEQTYNCTWFTTFILPNATLTNHLELNKTWSMDFGNGTNMEAFIAPLGPDPLTIDLWQRMVVTEKTINVTEPQQLAETDFLCYKIFNIEYFLSNLASNRYETKDANPGSTCCGTEGAGGVEDFRLSVTLPRITILDEEVRVKFKDPSEEVEVVMDVSFDLYLKGCMGLKTSWFKLRRFEAYTQLGGSLNVNFTANFTVGHEHLWEEDIFYWKGPIHVSMVGYVPVVWRYTFAATAKLNVTAEHKATISCGAKAEGSLKIGAGWKRHKGFYPIFDADMDVTRTRPLAINDVDQEVWITPSLGFRPAVEFYFVTGPSAELEPYVKLYIEFEGSTIVNHTITVGIRLNVGIAFSKWLRKITGLNNWYPVTIWEKVIWTYPRDERDVAVSELRAPTQAFINENITVSADVENLGNQNETVTVASYHRKNESGSEEWTLIGSKNVTLTAASNYTGSLKTVIFNYNTTEMTSGMYDFKANASIPLDGEPEKDTNDNKFILENETRIDEKNVAVVDVTPCKCVVLSGTTVDIYVTVKNKGTAGVSTFPVFAYYDGNPISDVWCEFGQWIFDLDAEASKTLTFTWDTTGVLPDNYTIAAKATILPYETNRTDNEKEDGNVTVTIEQPFRDVGCCGIEMPTNEVYWGNPLSIDVSVCNYGSIPEYVNVSLFYRDSTWLLNFTRSDGLNITALQNCTEGEVVAGYDTPEPNSWWHIIEPERLESIEFHVDLSNPLTGLFHIDEVLVRGNSTSVAVLPPVPWVLAEREVSVEETKTVGPIPPMNCTTVTFALDTTQFEPCYSYALYFVAHCTIPEPIEDEDPCDNKCYRFCAFYVKLTDIDGSGKVDLNDLFLFAKAWMSRPGDENWNPKADFDNSGKVDLADLYVFGKNWWQSC